MRRIKIILSLCYILICATVFAQSQYVILGDVTYSGIVHGHSKVTINSEYVTSEWDDNGIKHLKSFKYSSYQCNPTAEALKIVSSTNEDDWLICFNGALTFTCGDEHHLSVFSKNDKTYLGLLAAAKNGTSIFASFKSTPHHEYVDLGLSVKWATCNVGASRPEEYGDYYAWGETSTKINYDFDTDKWINIRNGHISLIKYNTKPGYGTVDNKTTLDANDDAANVNWGDHWRMPTDAEWTELRNNCTWTWTKLNGVMGYMVTSNQPGYTDKSIFLPAAGSANDSNVGFKGRYLSSSLNLETPMCAWGVVFDANAITRSSNSARSSGCPIRPVYK